jgi:hypothetical protein
VCGTTPPAGYVASNDDCCDVGGDAVNIFPGQKKWFTSQTTSCGKGWDYDCDSQPNLQYPYLYKDQCVAHNKTCPNSGLMWKDAVQACGAKAKGYNCLGTAAETPSGWICLGTAELDLTQGCH